MLDTHRLPCVQVGQRYQAALHLPVAPLCNVQCGYCQSGGDCVHHSPRGSTTRLLTPQQATSYALESIRREPRISCVGVSGPGDPLASADATLTTFSLLRPAVGDMPFFVVTNGFGLNEHAAALVELGVSLCIVAVNSLNPDTVCELVEWVRGPDGLVTGPDAANLLVERQLAGIRTLALRNVAVRVNFQLLPGVNDHEVESVAAAVKEAGAGFFQVLPFEPPSSPRPFSEVPAPDAASVDRARERAASHLEVVPSCARCASDSVGCGAEVRRATLRDALEEFSRQQDSPLADRVSPAPALALAERGISPPQLQLIARVARWLATSENDTLTTLRQVLVWLDEHLGLRRAVVALADASGDVVQAQVTSGVDPEQAERMRYRTDEGITGQVFKTGQPVFLAKLGAHPSFLDRSGLRSGLDLNRLAFFCVPVLDRGTVLGTLSADKDNSLLKDADADLNLLQEVAQLLAPFSPRPLLSAERISHPDAPAARARQGGPDVASRSLRRSLRPRHGKAHLSHRHARHRHDHRVPLAWQRAGAGERHRAGRGAGRGGGHSRSPSAPFLAAESVRGDAGEPRLCEPGP